MVKEVRIYPRYDYRQKMYNECKELQKFSKLPNGNCRTVELTNNKNSAGNENYSELSTTITEHAKECVPFCMVHVEEQFVP